MKKKINHLSKSTLSIVLSLLMILSTSIMAGNAAFMDLIGTGTDEPRPWYVRPQDGSGNWYDAGSMLVANTQYSSSGDVYYANVPLYNGKLFCLQNTNNNWDGQYGDKSSSTTKTIGDSFYGQYSDNKCWTYNGTTNVVRVKVDESAGSNGYNYPQITLEDIDWHLSGYINGNAITTVNSTYKFTRSSADTYTYSLTVSGDADQYVTVNDGKNMVYHAASLNSTSSASGTVDTGFNENNKWLIDTDDGDVVTFTWNPYEKTLSWSIVSAETKYTVTASAGTGGSVTPSSASAGNVTAASFTATPDAGYSFSSWTTSDSGITINSPSTATTTVNATAAGTITANFTEKATKTISVDVDDHVSVTVSGSSVAGQNQTFTTDGSFTAHVDDVISFSAAGNPSSTYTYDTLQYSTDGSSYTTGKSFTVADGTYIIKATSKEKSGGFFYVNTTAGVSATVTLTDTSKKFSTPSGNVYTYTVAAGSRQKFVVDDASLTFTISSVAATGYKSNTVKRVMNTVETNKETPVTVSSSDTQTVSDVSGATYYASVQENLGDSTSYYLLKSTSDDPSSLTNTGLTVYKKTIGETEHKYVVIPNSMMNGTSEVWFALSDSSSYTGVWYREQGNNKSNTVNVTVDSGSTTYITASCQEKSRSESGNTTWYQFPKIKFNDSSLTGDVLIDAVTGSGSMTYTISYYSSGSVTSFDTYYLGGRFRIADSDTGSYVYTDATEGSWQTYSIKMPFTLTETANVYKLETNQTIAQLSSELNDKLPYFIVHDKSTVYASSSSSGLNFENQVGSSNALTLASDSDLTYQDELLFSDADSNSDGMVTIYFNSSTKAIWYELTDETAAVASSVSLTALYGEYAYATINQDVTLTATVSSAHANAGTLTYTFINTTTGETIYSGTDSSCTTTDDTVRTDTYKVIVSSSGIDPVTGKTLRPISDTEDFQYKNPNLFRTDTDLAGSASTLTDSGSWNNTAITDSSVASFVKDISANNTFEFALATAIPEDDNDLESTRADLFYVDTNNCRYCDVTSSSITVTYTSDDDVESYTVITYKVTPRTGTSGNTTIYIDTHAYTATAANGETVYYPGRIYATSSYTPTKTNTKASTETVTYYFAEATGNNDDDQSVSGDGMAIAYWNNSLDIIQTNNDFKYNNSSAWADAIIGNAKFISVSTPVNVDGSNQITVDMTKLYDAKSTNENKTFKVYSVDLPIWATSFAFMKTATDPEASDVIKTYSLSSTLYDYSSLLLNPNRIYLLYSNSTNWYCKGVVLDKGLWNSSTKNDPGTKTFKSNVINFNKTYNSGGSVKNDFNSWLSTRKYSSYYPALYFGYFAKDASPTLNNFNIINNLAMRNSSENDERYYFASAQNLVAEKLNTSSVNSNGFPLLEGYEDSARTSKVNMPLFDYDALATDKSSYSDALIDRQLLGVDFPMYEGVFNGITTYSYDSSTDPNRAIDPSTGNFVIDTYRVAKSDLGYEPFIKYSGTDDSNKYGNATELDVEFYMSNTGKLKDTNNNDHDITFNFTGDDDVWVYVDGVLVLDLGGAHKASAGSINFTDMMVYYKTAAKDAATITGITDDTYPTDTNYINTVNMQSLLAANGVNFNNKDAATKHTFQMFYMERGQFDSNMSVSYNLPQASGLNIKNEVTTNNVNPGLVNATKYAADSDYFTYGVSAALNSGSLYDYTTHAYSGASKNAAANSAINAEAGPAYPYSSNTNHVFSSTVNRGGSTETLSHVYPLSRTNENPANGSTYSETTSFTALSGVTYNLSDTLLNAASVADEDLEVTGITDTAGEFHLLNGQAAGFDDKVTPHSFVKVYQKNDLGKVGYTNANTPIGFETVSDNGTHNYYITSYSIYDDHSSTWIKEKTQVTPGTSSNIYAADDSENSNMFYFSDYGKAADSAAMTVTFYNDVAVGDIRISKAYNGDANTTFYFDLTFANIFGDTSASSLVAYNDLKYDVVNTSTGGIVKRDVMYGATGIALQAGQTAVISGVPVETRYQVTERAKSGTQLTALEKTIKGPDGNYITNPTPVKTSYHGYEESFGSTAIKDNSIRSTSTNFVTIDGDKYYVNMIPRVTESVLSSGDYLGQYKTTSYVAFTNEKTNLKIKFYYYDRGLVEGSPASIRSDNTVYIVNGALPDTLEEGKTIATTLSSMIEGAAIEFSNQALTQNVVDDYVMWSSQVAATGASGISSKTNIKTGKAYASTQYHTDYLSQPLASGTDEDKWVSYWVPESENSVTLKYYDAESESDYAKLLNIKEVHVWLFNTPHEYSVNIYGAKSLSELGAAKTVTLNGVTQSVRVANAGQSTNKLTNNTKTINGTDSTVSNKVYYNQRLGEQLSNGSGVNETSYISQYDKSGYVSTIEPVDYITRDRLNDTTNNKTYRFAYWAYDPAGQVVASTNAYFYYRITNDVDLYAVYAESDIVNPALTIYANRNDTYVNASGISRTRLNIMLNPYNLEDSDAKLKQTALVYVNLSSTVAGWSNSEIINLFNQYRTELDEILTQKAANTFNATTTLQGLTVGQDSVNVTLTTKGFVRNAKSNLGNGIVQVTPTAKNRVQYTMDLKTSTIKNTDNLMIVGAMYYADTYNKATNNWKISDNCLIYQKGTAQSLDFGLE